MTWMESRWSLWMVCRKVHVSVFWNIQFSQPFPLGRADQEDEEESFSIQSNRLSQWSCSLEWITSSWELVGKDQRIYQHGVCDIAVQFCYRVPNREEEVLTSAGSLTVTGHGSHGRLYRPDICWKDNAGGYKQYRFLKSIKDYFLTQVSDLWACRGRLLDMLFMIKERLIIPC